MKNSYGVFFIQSQLRNHCLTRGKSVSSSQKSAIKMNQSVRKAFTLLAPLQSSFHRSFQSFKFYPVFSQISYKLQTTAESSNRFIASDKPIKKYIRKQQNKKESSKNRRDVRIACLANSSNRRGKYRKHCRRQRVLLSKEMSRSSKQMT